MEAAGQVDGRSKSSGFLSSQNVGKTTSVV